MSDEIFDHDELDAPAEVDGLTADGLHLDESDIPDLEGGNGLS